jgi:hypothetical protein
VVYTLHSIYTGLSKYGDIPNLYINETTMIVEISFIYKMFINGDIYTLLRISIACNVITGLVSYTGKRERHSSVGYNGLRFKPRAGS